MKDLFDSVSVQCSRITTRSYSTSFSLGIKFLHKRFQDPIYSIYGFVRFADEIVDSFHGYDKLMLLKKFRQDTYEALEQKISLNPILNSFQKVVHKYGIEHSFIDTFLQSMEMDLAISSYNRPGYEQYIFGSAEVVGLMCLKVFTEGNGEAFDKLKPSSMYLGAAFQKVNFLRDLKMDYETLGRSYFPKIDMKSFSIETKRLIEAEIENDFTLALKGIKQLPPGSRQGVYLAYVYYRALFRKIKKTPAEKVIEKRIRIPNSEKFYLMLDSYIRYQMNIM